MFFVLLFVGNLNYFLLILIEIIIFFLAINVEELLAYAQKISFTTSAPRNWNPQLSLGRFRPPYPQDGIIYFWFFFKD